MNDILAAQTDLSECPNWCGGHLPAEDGLVHVSAEKVIPVSAGSENHTLWVSIEQADVATERTEPASIRIEGAASAPMTLAQAMQLAHVLQATVFAALTGGQVSR